MKIYVVACAAVLLCLLGVPDLRAGQAPGHSGMTAVPVQLGTVVASCAASSAQRPEKGATTKAADAGRSEGCLPCQSGAGTAKVSIRLEAGITLNVTRQCANTLAAGDKVWVLRGRNGGDQVVKALQ